MKKITLIAAALAAVNAFAITATKEYVDNATNATLTASKSYTDQAVAGCVPGNYETVSNRAMNAVQTETDPTVPSWAKAANKPSYTASEVGALPSSKTGTVYHVGEKVRMRNTLQVDGKVSAKADLDVNGDVNIQGDAFVGGQLYGCPLAGENLKIDDGGDIKIGNDKVVYSVTVNGTQVKRGDVALDIPQCYEPDPALANKAFEAVEASYAKAPMWNGLYFSWADLFSNFERDPLVPAWAKAANKPSYTASEVGAATPAYVDQQNAATRAIVATWENFLDGSNVVFSITNYISGTYNLDTAKLRIMEMTNGVYREVYNSRDEILLHIDDFKNTDFRVATNQVIQGVSAAIANKADKAWGKYTSAGGEAPSNTVYMTAPNTVFAGGMEYERVAVGEGSVCILTTKGAPVYTQGDEGTFKFQDDGGTNYFGFAKTDSYVIGANASGITVQNHIVTINYDVTMSGVPCIWYKQAIESAVEWEQLNLPDGTPVAGASHVVSWDATPPAGRETCYINCPEAKGFFKATIEVPGSAKFMTNMPADFSGGILCTDGEHKVKINWNNGAPTLVPAN